jgi:hypothetical protein
VSVPDDVQRKLDAHNDLWDALPLQAPVPVPPDHDGEFTQLHDLAELVFERVELIAEFDPAFVQQWIRNASKGVA